MTAEAIVRPRGPHIIGVLMCSVLLIASCGGDDKPAASATTKPATATTKAVAGANGASSGMDGFDPSSSAPTTAGAAGAASAGVPEACKLVTQQEAEALGGHKLDPANQVADSCTFTGPTDQSVAQVEVFVGDGAKKFLDIDHDLQHEFTPIAGAADEAYYEENTAFLRKGTLWVALRLTRLNDPAENKPKLEALARTVAGRL